MRRPRIVVLSAPLFIAVFVWLIISNYGFLVCRLAPDSGKWFNSLDELENFLREDDLNEREPSAGYTCANFVRDFISRAQAKGYCHLYFYSLSKEDMIRYKEALSSIKVVKENPEGVEIRDYSYFVTFEDVGHAVVKTKVGKIDVIIDPQIDVVLALEDFSVLYEGEILYD
ncbi:MAG: hypothetical protein QXW82_03300 [Candidatus Bathyarchaeia archaeon]